MRKRLRRQQFCDAEVEQLRRAVAGDENVRGLDVPVHDQIAMRELHRRADADEQLQAFANEQGTAVAVGVDGFAVDVLHHEIRGAVLEIAAVDEARDRRMSECRENVPLAVQAAAQARMQRRMVQHLDGDDLLILSVVALASIDGAHAAVTENRYHPVVADMRADQSVLMLRQQRLGRFADRIQQRVLGRLIGREERLDRAAQLRVGAARVGEARPALLRGRVDDLLEHRVNLLPAGAGDHAERPPAISFSSQARASRISR